MKRFAICLMMTALPVWAQTSTAPASASASAQANAGQANQGGQPAPQATSPAGSTAAPAQAQPGTPSASAAAVPNAAATAPINCRKPAPTVPPAQRKWKAGLPEYKAYVAATKAVGAQQIADLNSFLQNYPNSDWATTARLLLMSAQARTNPRAALSTAQQILHSPDADAPSLATAYATVAYLMPTIAQPNTPQFQLQLNQLQQSAQCGSAALAQLAVPQGESAALFQQQKQQSQYTFDRAQGFVALQRKQYSAAIASLQQAASMNPKDALVFYWLGIAQAETQPPHFNSAIWSLAHATALAPQAAPFSQYLDALYKSYHGSMDGLQQVVQQAQSSPTPPANFHIQSAQEIAQAQANQQAAQEQAAANAQYQAQLKKIESLPITDAPFFEMKRRLLDPSLSARSWRALRGQALGFQGVVVKSTPQVVEVAVTPDAQKSNTPEIAVHLGVPHKFPAGATVSVGGVLTTLSRDPFLITMTKGRATVKR